MIDAQNQTAQIFHIFALIISLGLSASAYAKREVTVFPKNSKQFRCQVGPESVPVAVEEGMLKLRVGVVGGKGPFYWRVPFQSWSNGDNRISLAQAGESASHDGRFTIAVDVTKLPMENAEKKIELRLIAKDGAETYCTTQITAIEEATLAAQISEAQKKAPLPVPDSANLLKQAAVQ